MAGKLSASLSLGLLFLVAGQSPAEETKGRVKLVDSSKATTTTEVGTTDQIYPVAADAKSLDKKANKGKKGTKGAKGKKGTKGKKGKKVTTREIPGSLTEA